MEQSQQVLEWQAEARNAGRVEGKAEGKVEAKAESVLRLLERRLSVKVPPDLATAITAIADLDRLDRLFDVALAAGSLDQFRHSA